MKIEIMKKLDEDTTLIVNELANASTLEEKIKLVKIALDDMTKTFKN